MATLCVLLCAAAASISGRSLADEPPDEPKDPNRIEPIILPALGGNSDIGFLFGVMGVLAQFEPGYDPYRWRGESVLVTAVKDSPNGAELTTQVYYARFDFPDLWDGRLRLLPELNFIRLVNEGYFGLGNASQALRPTQGIEPGRFNQYVLTLPWAKLDACFALGHGFEAIAGAMVRAAFVEPYPGSKLEQDASAFDADGDPLLRGVDPQGHGHVRLALGGRFDSRDHETVPQRGMLHALGGYIAPAGVMGYEHWFGGVNADARFFVPLADEYLVFALRLLADLQFGEPPVYQLGRFGVFRDDPFTGVRGLRGPPRGRFHGLVKVLGNAELRSLFLPFTLFEQRFHLGATAFYDTGRVWAGYRHDPVLDGTSQDLKYGVGGGPRLQWGETVLIRFDVAYSPQAADGYDELPVGLYLEMHQLF